MKPGDVEDRLISFAVRVVNVVKALPDSKAGNHRMLIVRVRRQIPAMGHGTSTS